MLLQIATPLMIAGFFLFGLWGLANVAYSIQGGCLLSFHISGAENCLTGYSSNSLTSPIVSVEFLLLSLAITFSGASLWGYNIFKRHLALKRT